ncbi:MAG TPA: NAD-dependent epimerase/dehydratase family protein [Rhodoglobus sp.]|nr:NAD-dependent epimerase/dehydratase family protein [Rhodoglobus sp.]
MTALRMLFIGGNGTISAPISRRVIEQGHDLTLLNRGQQSHRPPIEGASSLTGDAGDPASVREAVSDREFDVVVNFRSFTPAQVQADIETFAGVTGQYVYISSASAYQKPVGRLPITESTPLRNPWWQYSRDKIASEDALVAAYRERGFPVTIVRPSHTYDEQSIPLEGGTTALARLLRGAPVVVHGDGTSLWTLTHSRDFAVAFTGLLGRPAAIGDVFQITSDEVLTWDAITRMLAAAAGVDADIVHVASDELARELPDWGPGILGDKSHSVVFDNSKVKSLVPEYTATIPFAVGAREIIAWHQADPSRIRVDDELDAAIDAVVARHRS